MGKRIGNMFSVRELSSLWSIARNTEKADGEGRSEKERKESCTAFLADTGRCLSDPGGLFRHLKRQFSFLETAGDRRRFIRAAVEAGVAGTFQANLELLVLYTKLLILFRRPGGKMAEDVELLLACVEIDSVDARARIRGAEGGAGAERTTGPFGGAQLEYLRGIVDAVERTRPMVERWRIRNGAAAGPLPGQDDAQAETIPAGAVPGYLEEEFGSLSTMEDRRRFLETAKARYAVRTGRKGWWEEGRRLLAVFVKLLALFGRTSDGVARAVETFVSSIGNPDGQKEQVVFETIASFPWGVTRRPNLDAASVMGSLEGKLYGMREVKEQIRLEVVLDANAEGAPTPAPLLLVGPPGTGKTSVGQAVAGALGLPFFKVGFSGNADIITLKGTNYGWSSAVPGIFVRCLVEAGCLNPVILLDEVDKTGRWTSGGDVINVLAELLDVNESARFSDQFLAGIPVDMSKVFFIATANDIGLVPQFVQDRCRVIEVPLYGEDDRRVIVRDYMAEQVKTQRRLPFAIEVSDEVAGMITAETDSLRVAKEMLTILVARRLEKGPVGKGQVMRLDRWDPTVADRFARKGNAKRTIGFMPPARGLGSAGMG